jgi:hypothetical protein
MTDPRDCEHGHLYRKRIGQCAACTEAELVRVEAERDKLLADIEAARASVPTRETDIATVRDANAFLRVLAERDERSRAVLREMLRDRHYCETVNHGKACDVCAFLEGVA